MISVIIPCYNHGQYLRFALESVLEQTFAQWEVIVVDDGSTDSTAGIIQEYRDARIRYIYQDNAGLSAARNTGIRAAHGSFLAFLDADDEWEPGFLTICYQALDRESGIAGVFTRCRYIDPDGALLPGIGGLEIEPPDFRSRLLEGGFFPVHTVLTRVSVLDRCGLFDTNLTSAEDWDLWLRISEWQSMRGLAQPLARYRVYPGSMSTNTERMHANRVAVLSKYFGSPDDDISTWSAQKRMSYGFAFRTSAIGFLRQGNDDLAWHWLERAFIVWPPLLERLDTFYELACKDQPRGYRGQAEMLDIDRNGTEILRRLNALFGNVPPAVLAACGAAYGNAYLALAMLSDQAGHWSRARGYLLRAARYNPRLISPLFLRRLAKLYTGIRIVGFMKSLGNPSVSSELVPPIAKPSAAKD